MRYPSFVRVLSAGCAIVAAGISTSAARAAVQPYTVASSEGQGAETYVQGGTGAANNFNSSTQVRVSNGGADLSQAYKGYVRFDLSQIPGWNGVANNASINLPFFDSQTGTTPGTMDWNFKLYGLNDGAAEQWDPATVNWNNAPGNDTASANGAGAGTTLISPFTVTGTGEGGITILSAALDQFLNADTNRLVTFLVVRDTPATAGADYVHAIAAPQAAFTGPTLTVPEPSAATLLLLPAALVARRRRRA